tara:strand:- start:426 stop:1028 length:603 start_codon:yes stop_codon:yes gene_type:complete
MSGIIGANLVAGRSSGQIAAVAAAGGGGAWNLIGTAVADDDASLTITGLDSTYDTYAMSGSDLLPISDGVALHMQFGDSSGIDSGSSDYDWHRANLNSDNTAYTAEDGAGNAFMNLIQDNGNNTGEGGGFMGYLYCPTDGTTKPAMSGTGSASENNTARYGLALFGGRRNGVIAIDRVLIKYGSGNIESGRFSVWGIAHA